MSAADEWVAEEVAKAEPLTDEERAELSADLRRTFTYGWMSAAGQAGEALGILASTLVRRIEQALARRPPGGR